MIYLLFSLVIIFFLLSLLHFYWAFGGNWGFEAALPQNQYGEQVLNPGPFASTFVGIGLLAMAVPFLYKLNLLGFSIPKFYLDMSIWFIAFLFTMRALGDFRYVGFFKRIKSTEFAQMDTVFYAPLCLYIALVSGIVLLF